MPRVRLRPVPCRREPPAAGTATPDCGSGRAVPAGKGPLLSAYAGRMLNDGFESGERHLRLADREAARPSVQHLWMYSFVPGAPMCAQSF